jgi:hypothetical protein
MIKNKLIAMKTLFNQHQNTYPFSTCNKSLKNRNDSDIRNEEMITEHIKAISKVNQQPQTEDLTDLMNYYLSVAG